MITKLRNKLNFTSVLVASTFFLFSTLSSITKAEDRSQITNLQKIFLGVNINNMSKKSASEDKFYNYLNQTYSDDDDNISLSLTKYFSHKDISDNFIYGFSVNVAHLKKFEAKDNSGYGGNPITLEGNYINPEIKVGLFMDEKKRFLINASYGKVFSDIKHRFADDNPALQTLSYNTSPALEGISKGIELAYNSKSNIIYKLGLNNIDFKRVSSVSKSSGGGTFTFPQKLSLRKIYIGFAMPITLDKIFK